MFRQALLLIAVFAACRQGTAAQAQGVGWTLDLPGQRLREGQVLTSPPGQEERLLSGLANAALVAVQTCDKHLPAIATKAALTIVVDVDGSVREAAAGQGGDALAACIARSFAGRALAGVKLSAKTQAKVQLGFAAATPDGGASSPR